MYASQDNQINAWVFAHLGDPAGSIGTHPVGSIKALIEALSARDLGATNSDLHATSAFQATTRRSFPRWQRFWTMKAQQVEAARGDQ